jgi:hypothetical protein
MLPKLGVTPFLGGPLTDGHVWRRSALELFTIVLGVLIALGVDSWAQEQADRKLEGDYLRRLAVDLRSLENIEPVAGASAGGLQLRYYDAVFNHAVAARRALDASIDDSETTMRLLGSVYAATWETRPRFPDATYMELLSTGRFGLLRDENLRVGLIQFYEAAELWTAYFNESADRGFRTFVRGAVPADLELAYECDPVQVEPLGCQFNLRGWDPKPFLVRLRGDDRMKDLLNLKAHEYARNASVVRSFIEQGQVLADLANTLR